MDDFLNNQRTQPRAEFSRELYRSLNASEAPKRRGLSPTLKLGAAVVAGALAAGALLSVPSVSNAAQSFLNLFRVRRIAAVEIDPARLKALQGSKIEMQAMLGDQVEVLKKPGESKVVADAAAASALAGISVRAPAALSEGFMLSEIRVADSGSVRVTADVAKAEALLQAVGVTDARLPANLDGAKVTLNTPPVVNAVYNGPRGPLMLTQARSPEVNLPENINLAQLGELGLRAVGLGAEDARRFASTVDWNSTLIVPIPTNAASFREVDVRGVKGLLITTNGAAPAGRRSGIGPMLEGPRSGPTLVWSEGDVVFALTGALSPAEIVTLANGL